VKEGRNAFKLLLHKKFEADPSFDKLLLNKLPPGKDGK